MTDGCKGLILLGGAAVRTMIYEPLIILDGSRLLGDLPPFWMIARPYANNAKDLTAIERQCALDAGVKAQDYGGGLVYECQEDAGKVMTLMSAVEPDALFFVVGEAAKKKLIRDASLTWITMDAFKVIAPPGPIVPTPAPRS